MIKICNDFASSGRNFGNKLFTYALGVILSEEQDLNLYIPPNSHIQRNGNVMLFPFVGIQNKRDIMEPSFYVSDSNLASMGLDYLIQESKEKQIFLDGYFSNYDYIKNHKNVIKKTYASLISEKEIKDDIVIMLRDSNVDPTFALPNQYYLEILENENFNNVYVSYDHYNKHSQLIEKLQKKYKVILLDLDIVELFREITSFSKIIASQGTFSFWASFLSKANKIYWPITKIGPNIIGHRDVNLIIYDEKRYNNIYV